MKYHLITLGCQMNISDSERIVTVLNEMGMSRTENEEEATLLGIVACSVRQKAIDKVYSRIKKWNDWKNQKSLLTFISGCILPSDREKFLKLFDIVFPMSELPSLPEAIKSYGMVTPASFYNFSNIETFWRIYPNYNSNFEAFIPIQNGCDKFCTFCAVPYTRGREVSRPSNEILTEVEMLVNNGYKSITLLGQNVNSYGLDKAENEISFPALLKKIGEIGIKTGKEFWTYFTSPHPWDMTEEVIDIIAEYPVLAKQIHLPLQSGDDKVLIRMNRKYRVDEYRKIVTYIHKRLPEATLFTDIITGFTGESEEQFMNTLKAVKEFGFNVAFVAVYSPRPGAVSSRWVDDVPQELKKQRLHLISEEVEKYSFSYNEKLIGKSIKVLITAIDKEKGFLTGLTEGKINIRSTSTDDSLVGNFVWMKIISASGYSLSGELVSEKTLA